MSEEHHEEEFQEVHAESTWDIMTDPSHLVAELAFEGIFLLLSIAWVRFKLRKRDDEHHHHDCEASDKVPMW